MGRNKNVKKAKMEFLEMGGKKERKRARWLKQQFRHRRRDQQTGRHRRENRQAGEGAEEGAERGGAGVGSGPTPFHSFGLFFWRRAPCF